MDLGQPKLPYHVTSYTVPKKTSRARVMSNGDGGKSLGLAVRLI
jgi:hypothetical protein